MIRASCLCGDVAWEASGPVDLMSHCHCSMCRKAHGAAFATYAAVAAEGFRFAAGEDGIARFESSPGFHRCFCQRCGSTVPGAAHEGRVFVPVGAAVGDLGAKPGAHIFAASAAPWYEITDSLTRFDAYPPGIPLPKVPERARPRAGEGRIGGSCLCAAVAFEIEGPIETMRHCHCTRCRRARSCAHASNAIVDADRVHWSRGEEQIGYYKLPEARRFGQAFCRSCGSPLPRVDRERGYAVVPGGAFDDDPGVRPSEHIFVADKAPWFDLSDALPRHEQSAPD